MEIDWYSKWPELVVGVVSGLIVLALGLLFPWGWRRRKEWAAKKAADEVGEANAIGGDAARYLVRVAEAILLALDAILSLAIGIMVYLLSTGAPHWWNLVLAALTGSLVGRSIVSYHFFQKEVRVAKHAVRQQARDVVKEGHQKNEDDKALK